jgi:hypothetical protein
VVVGVGSGLILFYTNFTGIENSLTSHCQDRCMWASTKTFPRLRWQSGTLQECPTWVSRRTSGNSRDGLYFFLRTRILTSNGACLVAEQVRVACAVASSTIPLAKIPCAVMALCCFTTMSVKFSNRPLISRAFKLRWFSTLYLIPSVFNQFPYKQCQSLHSTLSTSSQRSISSISLASRSFLIAFSTSVVNPW